MIYLRSCYTCYSVYRFFTSDANRRKIRAKASYSYAPENDDELPLEVGDVIEITKQVSSILLLSGTDSLKEIPADEQKKTVIIFFYQSRYQ